MSNALPDPSLESGCRVFAQIARPPLGALHGLFDAASVDRLVASIAACTGRPAGARFVSAHRDGASAPRWGVRLREPSAGELWLALDLPACRAIVDALAHKHGGLRGSGDLTRAELGVLEFAALECADALGGATLSVEAFSSGGELRRQLAALTGATARFELALGARRGEATVQSSKGLGNKVFATSGEVRGALPVSVALPAIELSAAELAALEPGAIVLLGAAHLAAPALSARLVSETGWSLCDAAVELDSATCIAVRADELRARPLATSARASVLPLVGGASLSELDVARWRAGATLSLSKDPFAPARLVRDDGRVHRCELVCAGGEAALRLLD